MKVNMETRSREGTVTGSIVISQLVKVINFVFSLPEKHLISNIYSPGYNIISLMLRRLFLLEYYQPEQQ